MQVTETFTIVYQEGSGEIVEKKSRFIAHVYPIRTEEEAIEHIENIKKTYWDARHNCYSYVLGERQELQRFSDDGEPSGTAGKPILEVLLGMDIHNTLVVVTRYFGGTLLGTGGLVRAYSAATKAGLENCVITQQRKGQKIAIKTDYNGLGKMQYILNEMEIPILDTIYTDVVEILALVPVGIYDALQKKMIAVTAGKAEWEELEETSFLCLDKEVIEVS
ncbi:MAG: YigZ family protein [Lachnospiraceae bacterium]|nr:YigZ family protein [Lachnospiraceae bacterium]